MGIKINSEYIDKINKKILAVSGTQIDQEMQGVMFPNDLAYAVEKVNSLKNPLDQASSFLFNGINGHPFTQGNKRTAFSVAKGILQSGGYAFQPEESGAVRFVVSIADGSQTPKGVRNWIGSVAHFTGSEMPFYETTSANVTKDKDLLEKMD